MRRRCRLWGTGWGDSLLDFVLTSDLNFNLLLRWMIMGINWQSFAWPLTPTGVRSYLQLLLSDKTEKWFWRYRLSVLFSFSFPSIFSPQALGIEREDTPCRSLTNPKKLSFPSECLIQSRRTTWTGTDGLTPSSCDMIKVIWVFFFTSLCAWFKLNRWGTTVERKKCRKAKRLNCIIWVRVMLLLYVLQMQVVHML